MDPAQLQASNLFYRHPDLYDQAREDGGATAKLITELVDTYGPPDATTLLDLGCGTGRDLAWLAARFACVGVDLQPDMIAYGRATRPGLDLRVGDLRTFRLGQPVDVIACLGNSLAYIHDNTGLRSAFATFAAHVRPGSLLVLHLLVAASLPAVTGAPARAARDDTRSAEVTLRYEWDLRRQLETTRRDWAFDDGRQAHDVIIRRVIFPQELHGYLAEAGFELVDIFGNPERRDAPLTGPDAYVVAQRLRRPAQEDGAAGNSPLLVAAGRAHAE